MSINLSCFPEIQCKGRNHEQQEVLTEPVTARVSIRQRDNNINIDVTCVYNTGGHGQRCKAAHPDFDKIHGKEAACPYSIDLPYAIDQNFV